MKKTFITSLVLATLPLVASAQAPLLGTAGFLGSAQYIINWAIILIASIALLVFFYGLVRFIFKIGGDAKTAAEGKTLMINGTVALFVMVSIWGLVRFMQAEFGITQNQDIKIPGFTK